LTQPDYPTRYKDAPSSYIFKLYSVAALRSQVAVVPKDNLNKPLRLS
jgi:hypothetical protein